MNNAYKCSDVAANVKKELDKRGLKPSPTMKKIGLGENTLRNFQTSMPKADTLAKIADFLEVSVDYLLGRSIPAPAELPDDAAELLSIFNRLNPQMKALLLSMAHNVLNSQEPASEPTYIFDDDPTYWRKEG